MCRHLPAYIMVATFAFPNLCLSTPLTPIMGFSPDTLDFGCVTVGYCTDLVGTISNMSEDPTSTLYITELTVTGAGYTIAVAPTLPAAVPGGRSIPVVIRACPTEEGARHGSLTVRSSNAGNALPPIPISNWTCNGIGARADRIIIRFNPGAVAKGAPASGPLDAYHFTVPGLAAALSAAHVIALTKWLPSFDQHSIYSTNDLGKDIILDDLSTIYLASMAAGHHALTAVYMLQHQNGTVYVTADHLRVAGNDPNDTFYPRQTGLHNVGQWGIGDDIDINAREAWDLHTGTTSAWVAILDTGIDTMHVDLAPRMRSGFNYVSPNSPPWDDNGHGTAVAGIIGATGNNDEGVVGVSWSPTGVAVKVIDSGGFGSAIISAYGIYWAQQRRIPILNMSYYGGAFNPLEADAARTGALAGSFLVSIMGNVNSTMRFYPAAHEHTVFAVGALYLNGQRWRDQDVEGCDPGWGPGSTYGSWIDVCAPGGKAIATTRRFNQYYDMDPAHPLCVSDGFTGTSAAAPFVSGIAALLESYRPVLMGEDFGQIMIRTARDVGPPHFDVETGHGLVRADAALLFVAPFKAVEQRQLDPVVSDQVLLNQAFSRVPGLTDGTYETIRYRLTATHEFDSAFLEPPAVWYRISGTIGWPASNPIDYYDTPPSWASVVHVSATVVTLETYVYEVHRPDLPPLFVPYHYDQARIAFTAIAQATITATDGAGTEPLRVDTWPGPSIGERVRVQMELPRVGNTALRIYDVSGRLVRSLGPERMPAGRRWFWWDGRNSGGHGVSNGPYFYTLHIDEATVGRGKLVIQR